MSRYEESSALKDRTAGALTDKEAAKPYFQKAIARARWQGFFIAAPIYLVTSAFFLFGRWTAP